MWGAMGDFVAEKFSTRIEKLFAPIDRIGDIGPNEKNRGLVRAAFVALIAVPVAIVVFNTWSLAKYAPPQEQKKPDGIENVKGVPAKKQKESDKTREYILPNTSVLTNKKIEGMAFGKRPTTASAKAFPTGRAAAKISVI